MRRDAQSNEAEDKQKREEVTLHNSADQLIHQTEVQLKDVGDKLSEEDKGRLDEAIKALTTANGGTDAGAIQSAIDEVNKVWSELATKMYAETQQASPEGGGDGKGEAKGSPDDDGEIQDADFEVVDDDSK